MHVHEPFPYQSGSTRTQEDLLNPTQMRYSPQPKCEEALATKGRNLQTLAGTIPTLSNSTRNWKKKIAIGRKNSKSTVRKLEKMVRRLKN